MKKIIAITLLTFSLSGCSYVNQAKQDANDFVNNTETAITETKQQVDAIQSGIEKTIETTQKASETIDKANQTMKEFTELAE
jgi:PBP1b-binding outer membrane lipoprotein LpoB